MTGRRGTWLRLAIVSWACLGAIGCVGMDQVERARDHAAALGARLDADADALEEIVSGMPPDDPDRPEALALAAAARTKASGVEAGVRSVDLALTEANNPSGMVGKALQVVMPFVPQPMRVPLTLGLAAAGAGIRTWQLRRGLSSVVRGLNTAIREDGAFAERFKAHADTFRATRTALAKRIVDKVAGQGVTTGG